jgi:CysZ protein
MDESLPAATDPAPGEPPPGAPGSDPSGRPRKVAHDTRHGAARCWSCGTAIGDSWPCPRCGTSELAPDRLSGAAGFAARLGKGAAAPFRGFGFLGRHPGLWTWIIAPLIVNALLCVAAFWLVVTHLGDWLPDMGEAWPAWIDWARSALGWLLEAVLWTVSLLAAAIVTLALSGVVNAPFYDLLSEKVEKAHFGQDDPGRPWSAFFTDLFRALRASLSLLVRYVAVMAVLVLLSFTVVGAPLLMVAGFYYGGLAQVDLVMARKLYPGRSRTAWARKHLPLLVGLGIPVGLLPLLMPFGIVGATLAWLEEPHKG